MSSTEGASRGRSCERRRPWLACDAVGIHCGDELVDLCSGPKTDHLRVSVTVFGDREFDFWSLLRGIRPNPDYEELGPAESLVYPVRVVGSASVVTLEEPPQTDPARQIQKYHGVGAGKPSVEIGDVSAVDDPGVFIGEVSLELAERVAVHGVACHRCTAGYPIVAVFPPQPVKMDDWKVEPLAQVSSEGRFARSDAADNGDPLDDAIIPRRPRG